MREKSLRDIAAGLVFVGFGLAFALAARGYGLGTARAMGPGFFPHALGWLAVVLGAIIIAEGLLRAEAAPIGPIPWRGILLISGAIVFFGVTVRGLGLGPSTFVAVFLAAIASRRTGLLAALLVAVALTIACYIIFVAALGLNLPLLGPWVRF